MPHHWNVILIILYIIIIVLGFCGNFAIVWASLTSRVRNPCRGETDGEIEFEFAGCKRGKGRRGLTPQGADPPPCLCAEKIGRNHLNE
jgi:hypothetical protein